MKSEDDSGAEQELIALKQQLEKKEKIIQALKDRVKHSIQRSGDAYAIFEQNIVLQDLVEQQTKNLHEAAYKAEAGSKAKSDFLAQMSHEIRTPLNIITGMSHLLLRTELSSKQKKFILNIQNASRSLLSIINDVLDVSKIEAGKMELENIEFAMSKVIDGLSSVFGVRTEKKQVEVLYSVDPTIPKSLLGDPLRLGQVLSNLCSNAIKFTEKGQIIVRAKVKNKNSEQVEIEFSVQDTGIGIDKEQAEKLFHPFSQADDYITRQYGGTGLGLSICKFLVAQMQGEIWLESEENIGSTFFFTAIFHRANEHSSSVDIDKNINTVTFTRDFLVLVVDDNQLNLEIISEMLKDMELKVYQAQSGSEAIELVEKNNFDLVLMDIQMPKMDGLEATRTIRKNERLNSLPIIAMTAHAMEHDTDKSIEAGMQIHLTKPIDPMMLKKTLIKILTEIHGQDIYTSHDTAGELTNS